MGNQDYNKQHDVSVSKLFELGQHLVGASSNEVDFHINGLLKNNFYNDTVQLIALLSKYNLSNNSILPEEEIMISGLIKSLGLKIAEGSEIKEPDIDTDDYFIQQSMLLLYSMSLCAESEKYYNILLNDPSFRVATDALKQGSQNERLRDNTFYKKAEILARYIKPCDEQFISYKQFKTSCVKQMTLIHQNNQIEEPNNLNIRALVLVDAMLIMKKIHIPFDEQLRNPLFKQLIDKTTVSFFIQEPTSDYLYYPSSDSDFSDAETVNEESCFSENSSDNEENELSIHKH